MFVIRNNFRVTKKFLITKFDCIFKKVANAKGGKGKWIFLFATMKLLMSSNWYKKLHLQNDN